MISKQTESESSAKWAGPIEKALGASSGARFYRCALQVNPFAYIQREGKASSYRDEDSYNEAIIQACLDQDIEAIAVMDHYRITTSQSLIQSARKAGIYVFPGFEAVTKDGVHFLCLFDASVSIENLNRIIGDCGILTDDIPSPTGNYDTEEFLDHAKIWGAACVAAHVCSKGGLLTVLSGQPRIRAWKSANFVACALPGPTKDAPYAHRNILENKDPQYRRDRPIAVLNSNDVSDPSDIVNPGTSSWIKMSQPSIEGLRQAFLDPESRIRLASEKPVEEHAEFVAMTWEGGFLDGVVIHFNENLIVLIGGRGTGKSSVIESLRYVLDISPASPNARKLHEGIVKNVLKNGTKISLLVRSHHPSYREYLIERTIPNPPIIKDVEGKVLDLSPLNVLPQVEVYGQHEISELASHPENLTHLLERFIERDPNLNAEKEILLNALEQRRLAIESFTKEKSGIIEKLSSLPAATERLEQYREAGVEEQLKDQRHLVLEERVLNTADERLNHLEISIQRLGDKLPLDVKFAADDELEDLPGNPTLSEIRPVLERLSQDLSKGVREHKERLERAREELRNIRVQWTPRQESVNQEYETILRKLQKDQIDGEDFLQLTRQVEELNPLKGNQKDLDEKIKEEQDCRRQLLVRWEDAKAQEFRQLERAANRVNIQLSGYVRVTVDYAGNKQALINLLRDFVGSRLSETVEVLGKKTDLSLKELADSSRAGREELVRKFKIPSAQAERIAESGESLFMQIEELDLPATTGIYLNVAGDGQAPIWQALENLSTGQKATAVLLLLLLESDAPLVVDQPEDDLDNRFITEGIVPKMRDEKLRRQFIFATHNANIPVLGDAELILGLTAAGEAGIGKATIPDDHMGSIDSIAVRNLVEEILEGGSEAFKVRHLKYGF